MSSVKPTNRLDTTPAVIVDHESARMMRSVDPNRVLQRQELQPIIQQQQQQQQQELQPIIQQQQQQQQQEIESVRINEESMFVCLFDV